MANPLHLGQGLAIDAGKCRVGTPLHMGHSRNRQARWVDAVHTAGGEQVAFAHVGIGLDESQLDPAAMLSRGVAVGHCTRARAQVEDGNGLVTVYQQCHFAHQRKDARDLPEHTAFVRWSAADSERDLLAGVPAALKTAVWEQELRWQVPGPVVLFDSAWPGGEADRQEHLRVPLTAGSYAVRAAYAQPGAETWVGLVQLSRLA